MRKAEKQINPVLGAFRDQVLFLKHNLNANAIAALQQEFSVISLDNFNCCRLCARKDRLVLKFVHGIWGP
jgi:hypothetical protein